MEQFEQIKHYKNSIKEVEILETDDKDEQ